MRRRTCLALVFSLVLCAAPGAGDTFAGPDFTTREEPIDLAATNKTKGEQRAFSVNGKFESTFPWVDTKQVTIRPAVQIHTDSFGEVENFTFSDVTAELWDAENNTVETDTFPLDQSVDAGEDTKTAFFQFNVSNSGALQWLVFHIPYDLWRNGSVAYTDTVMRPLHQHRIMQTAEAVEAIPGEAPRGSAVNLSGRLNVWKPDATVTDETGDTVHIDGSGRFTVQRTVPRDVDTGTYQVTANLSTAIRGRVPVTATVSVTGDAPELGNITAPDTVAWNASFTVTFTASDPQTPRNQLQGWVLVDGDRYNATYQNESFHATPGFNTSADSIDIRVAAQDETGGITRSEKKTVTVTRKQKEAGASSGPDAVNGGGDTSVMQRITDLRGSKTGQVALLLLAITVVTGFYLYFSTGADTVERSEAAQDTAAGETDAATGGYFAEQQELAENVESNNTDGEAS